MKYVLKLSRQTRRTAIYDTSDPLAPVGQLYLSKSWIALQQAGRADLPGLVEIEVGIPARQPVEVEAPF